MMKITACINCGEDTITQAWDFDYEKGHLIVRQFESDAIAIRIEQSRIKITTSPSDMVNKLHNTAPQIKEHIEAAAETFIERVYLGSLSLADAVLIRTD